MTDGSVGRFREFRAQCFNDDIALTEWQEQFVEAFLDPATAFIMLDPVARRDPVVTQLAAYAKHLKTEPEGSRP